MLRVGVSPTVALAPFKSTVAAAPVSEATVWLNPFRSRTPTVTLKANPVPLIELFAPRMSVPAPILETVPVPVIDAETPPYDCEPVVTLNVRVVPAVKAIFPPSVESFNCRVPPVTLAEPL